MVTMKCIRKLVYGFRRVYSMLVSLGIVTKRWWKRRSYIPKLMGVIGVQ
jgi:hypothetical protein